MGTRTVILDLSVQQSPKLKYGEISTFVLPLMCMCRTEMVASMAAILYFVNINFIFILNLLIEYA